MGQNLHAEGILAGCFRLRSLLRRKLVAGLPASPPWILDTVCSVDNGTHKTVIEKLDALKQVCAPDGVHLMPDGYCNVAKNISATLQLLQEGKLGKVNAQSRSAAVPIAGAAAHLHYWKGFSSPVGSQKKSSSQSWGKFPRERGNISHQPYKRWGRGGKGFWKN